MNVRKLTKKENDFLHNNKQKLINFFNNKIVIGFDLFIKKDKLFINKKYSNKLNKFIKDNLK